MEQWQYEVTEGGRLWYCIDDGRRTVWLMDASPGECLFVGGFAARAHGDGRVTYDVDRVPRLSC